MFDAAVASEREHVRVLAQQQQFGRARLARRHQPLLQLPGIGVTDTAELDHAAGCIVQVHAHGCLLRPAPSKR